jgi:hypothetical protein
MLQCGRQLRRMPHRSVELSEGAEGISVSSAAWSEFISWAAMARLALRKSVVLVALGRAHISRAEPGFVRVQSVFGDEILPNEAMATLWRFPILWVRPSMAQLFLVIPRNETTRETTAAVAKRIGQRVAVY